MVEIKFVRERWAYPVAIGVGLLLVDVAIYNEFVTKTDLHTLAISITGTFVGAIFAFYLTIAKERTKLLETRREAINRALLTLTLQANVAHGLVTEFQRFPSHLLMAFKMPALQPPLHENLVFNLGELDFLLDSGEPTILLSLAVEEDRFHQMIASIRARNTFYVEEVQPELAKIDKRLKVLRVSELKQALGERVFSGAYQGAVSAYDHVAKTALSVPKAHESLLKLAKKIFPGRKFMDFELTIEHRYKLDEPFPPIEQPIKNYTWR